MSEFTMEDRELLSTILKMSQDDLHIYLAKLLVTQYNKKDLDMNKDYLFVRGTDPIMFVAHMDTVYDHKSLSSQYFKEKIILYDSELQMLWSPDGLGADDRVGIFMILKLIRDGFSPYILFTRDEEIGAKSAAIFASNYKNKLKKTKIKYIIQLDRRGSNDCVFYSCDNPEFTKYISSFGFVPAIGLFSDISVICPLTGIAGVNLSVGYYNEHTDAECLCLLETIKNYDIIVKMIQKSKILNQSFIYIEEKLDFKKGKGNKKLKMCDCCLEIVRHRTFIKNFGYVCDTCKKFLEV